VSDRTPPQDLAAEQAVLGSMMISAAVIPDVTAMLAGSDYYRPNHEAIHEAIVALYSRREPVDMVTVAGELERRGELQRIGGAPYLHTVHSSTPIAANATYYAQHVVDAALRRRLIEAGTRVVQQAYAGEGDVTQLAEDARREVDEAASQVRTAEGGTSIGAGLDAAVDWLETPPVGADTPWPDVNDRTNGLLAGQMVTVAARPGHGKSLCAANVGLFTAMQDKPVHIATLEMGRNEYVARILANLAGVNLSNMLRRQMTDQEWQRVGAAGERVRELPLYLDDRERQSMAQIRAAARQTQRKYGRELGLVAIDYAQLVQPEDRRLPREQQVAQISRDTKLLAKEFGCPVMLLAQLNRGNVSRSDPTPMVSDLRESGALEQDSDQVWLLHRPDQYGDEERLGEVDLVVGKNRNGPSPVAIPLAFQGHYGRLASLV
jgi:replicative DNA helicase